MLKYHLLTYDAINYNFYFHNTTQIESCLGMKIGERKVVLIIRNILSFRFSGSLLVGHF